MIPFNKPFLTGNETKYIQDAVASGKISGDGLFSKKCHHFFEKRYGIKKALLTSSCTDALEMTAILSNLNPDDEVIAPSYTFVSSVNPFIMQGAKIVFADVHDTHPNIDENEIEKLITVNTKAIVLTHYSGIACNMDVIMKIANQNNILVIEDAAHCTDAFYNEKPLGSIGAMASFSFHETKNIIAGEGGLIAINDERFIERAEMIREKGTNRSKFYRGEINKYEWVDIGSSFLPSEVTAAFLFAQLENIDNIQKKRIVIWHKYYHDLAPLADEGHFMLPYLPGFANVNGHIFYIKTKSLEERTKIIDHLKSKGVHAVFHYMPLHLSPYYLKSNPLKSLPNTESFSDCLLRLPLFFELKTEDQDYIIKCITEFYKP